MIGSFEIRTSKAGNNFATFTLEDLEGSISCMMWSSVLEKYRAVLEEDRVIHVRGKVERSDRGIQLIVYEADPLDLAEGGTSSHGPSALAVHVESGSFSGDTMARLSDIFSMYPGAQPVTLFIEQSDGRKFRAELPVSVNCASNEMLRRVEEVVGAGAAQLS